MGYVISRNSLAAIWVAPVLMLAPYGLWMWGQLPRTRSLAVAATLAQENGAARAADEIERVLRR